MKTFLRTALIGLIVIFFSALSFANDYTFRKTKWGMSIKQVKASEPLDVVKEEESFLGYKTTVIGKNVYIAYVFIGNRLVRTRYALADSHTNKNDFITDYNDFKEILTKKYGKPKEDEKIWKNDLYKDDYSDWGTAIGMGHLIYFSTWETQDTEIQNILLGENFADSTGFCGKFTAKVSCLLHINFVFSITHTTEWRYDHEKGNPQEKSESDNLYQLPHQSKISSIVPRWKCLYRICY